MEMELRNSEEFKGFLHSLANEGVESEAIKNLILRFPRYFNEQTDDGSTPLHYAAYYLEDCNIVQMMLDGNADMTIKDKKDNTPLHVALVNSPGLLSAFVTQKSYLQQVLNSANSDGLTPLHLAVKYKACSDDIAKLISLGAIVTAKDTINFNTPLHIALLRKREWQVINELLKGMKKSSTNMRGFVYEGINEKNKDGLTALHLSAGIHGDVRVVKALLKAGADVNAANSADGADVNAAYSEDSSNVHATNSKGVTPLLFALRRKCNRKMTELLISAGANYNVYDKNHYSALHYAVRYGCSVDVVCELVNNGADLSFKTEIGFTPLHLAIISKAESQIVELLINAMDIVNKDITCFGQREVILKRIIKEIMEENILDKMKVHLFSQLVDLSPDDQCSFSYEREKYLNLVLSDYLNYNPILDAIDDKGRTALHFACMYNTNFHLIKKMVDAGFNTKIKDKLGFLPLHYALQYSCHLKLLKMLLQNQERLFLNLTDIHGCNALHLSIKFSCPYEVIDYFVNSGADISAKDEQGFLPLHLAVSHHCEIRIITKLLSKDLIDVTTKDGHSPLYIALQNRSELPIILKLISEGADLIIKKNGTGKECTTALHLAAIASDFYSPDLIQSLLETMSQDLINMRNISHKATALHFAVEAECTLEIVDKFISAGASILKDKFNCTPLHTAIMSYCDINIIKKLLENTPKEYVNDKLTDKHIDSGCTALHLAITYLNNNDIIEELVHTKANISKKDSKHNLPLHLAIRQGYDLHIIRMLHAGNKKLLKIPNESKHIPLHTALISKSKLEVVRELLDLHLEEDLFLKDVLGCNALHIAIKSKCDTAVIKMILDKCSAENKEEITNELNLDNLTALDLALDKKYQCPVEVITELIKAKADLRHHYSQDQLLLHVAVANNFDSKIVEEILNNTHPFLHNKHIVEKNHNAFHLAVENDCSIDVIRVLIRNKVSPRHLDSNGHSSLHLAVKKRRYEVIEEILRHYPDEVNVPDLEGIYPIDMAQGDPKCLELLSNVKIQIPGDALQQEMN